MTIKTTQLGFVLGRDHVLSVAELFALFARKNIEAKTVTHDRDILIVELDSDVKNAINLDELGGTIKIFEVLATYSNFADIKPELIKIIPENPEKRINFGVSGYGRLNKKVILNLGYEIKEEIVSRDLSARFVTGKSIDLSSVIVHENKLIERGFEAIIYFDGKNYTIGRTLAVQNYKAYSKRDFGRPQRDDRNGMLPPKLAQIMINLAEAPLDGTVYDPFCGSGTILQEAILLGYKNVYGSDLGIRNIEDTKANLEWLSRITNYQLPVDNVFVSDVLTPTKNIQADAIVGEGFLGDPFRRDKNQAIKDAEELSTFYVQALTNLAKQLKDGGRIVLAIPFFVVKNNEFVYLPILEKISETGLTLIKPDLGKTESKLFGRSNLTYSRADQFVGREILILEKQA